VLVELSKLGRRKLIALLKMMKNLSGGKVIINYVIIYLIKSLKQPVVWRTTRRKGCKEAVMCLTLI
jgi:hypothetical protein